MCLRVHTRRGASSDESEGQDPLPMISPPSRIAHFTGSALEARSSARSSQPCGLEENQLGARRREVVV